MESEELVGKVVDGAFGPDKWRWFMGQVEYILVRASR